MSAEPFSMSEPKARLGRLMACSSGSTLSTMGATGPISPRAFARAPTANISQSSCVTCWRRNTPGSSDIAFARTRNCCFIAASFDCSFLIISGAVKIHLSMSGVPCVCRPN